MIDKKKLTEFLKLFSYADDDKKKKESIDYIIERLETAEKENKILTFEKLGDIEYSPNPLLDRQGKLMFDTKSFIKFYEDYASKVQFVRTEIANLVRETWLIASDIAHTPMEKNKDEDEE